jgi:hypothetical protein
MGRYQVKFGKIFYVCAVATFISFSALAQGLPKQASPKKLVSPRSD